MPLTPDGVRGIRVTFAGKWRCFVAASWRSPQLVVLMTRGLWAVSMTSLVMVSSSLIFRTMATAR